LEEGLSLADTPPLLRGESLAKEYPTGRGALVVLREVSLELRAGQAAVIMGPSGSGKSTLLNILGTLEPPTRGRVLLAGRDPFALSEKELAGFRNQRVGFVFQNHYLLPQCSALENVLIPTLPRAYSEATAQRGRRLLERVGLAERCEHLPAELSGGESQRVAVARAMVNSPALLLADEPTGNLDHRAAAAVVDLLLEVQREEGVGLIMVTHSRELAERFDRRYRLEDGVLSEG
jgi:lipoprotein-releasing system ATP-binding protein